MAYGADLANDLLCREEERVLRLMLRTTHLVAVRTNRNTVEVGAHEWRVGQQDEHLADTYPGLQPYNALRSRRWAAAWIDGDGQLHVRGNSEALKRLLTQQFHVLSEATMDEQQYSARTF